jgi:hypothetical protein
MKKLLILITMMLLFGCEREADVVSRNISASADQFEIYRRVVFYNGITDQYILVVEGYCSINIDKQDGQLELTVKDNDGSFKKHYLGLSDNVTYFAEQLSPARVSKNHYRVIFKPSTIIPDIDVE